MNTIDGERTSKLIDVSLDRQSPLLKQIEQRAEPLIEKIVDEKKKDTVREFWYNHFFKYVSLLKQIDYLIMEEEITPEDAYDEIYYNSKKIVNEGDKIEEFLGDKRIISEIKDMFRELSGEWLYRSKVMKQALQKPSGYAGDYNIIEEIYNNSPKSRGIGYCFDIYFLENSYAKAVRGRKQTIKKILHNFLKEKNSDIEILNIACGPSREIKELLTENSFNKSKRILFSLVDHDINALLYSQLSLKNTPKNIEYKFIKNSIFDFFKNPIKYNNDLMGKDIIYSLGLLDYLSDKVISKLVLFLYGLLNPGGKLIIAHPDSKKNKPIDPDWFCDWILNIRSKEDLIDIINNSGITNFSLKTEIESITKIIFFLIIKRKD